MRTLKPRGFMFDVPVTLTLIVRGEIAQEEAAKIARQFVWHLDPSDMFCERYSDDLPYGVAITEATLESSEEDEVELLEELKSEADEEADEGTDNVDELIDEAEETADRANERKHA